MLLQLPILYNIESEEEVIDDLVGKMRARSWYILMYYPIILRESLRRGTKYL
jgi:hypothetical protein